jgi:Sugar phosphate permease
LAKLVYWNIYFTSCGTKHFFGASWGILYLQQTRNFTEITSSYIIGASIIGGIVGSPLIGWLSDKLFVRKLPLLIATTVSLVTILILAYLPDLSLIDVLGLFFVFGLAGSAQVVCFPLVAQNNPTGLTGSATGFVAALGALGGIYMPIFNKIMVAPQNHKIATAISQQPINSPHLIMLILISTYVISLLTLLLVKETRCEPKRITI